MPLSHTRSALLAHVLLSRTPAYPVGHGLLSAKRYNRVSKQKRHFALPTIGWHRPWMALGRTALPTAEWHGAELTHASGIADDRCRRPRARRAHQLHDAPVVCAARLIVRFPQLLLRCSY